MELFALIFVLFIGVAVVVAMFSKQANEIRQSELSRWASEKGFAYRFEPLSRDRGGLFRPFADCETGQFLAPFEDFWPLNCVRGQKVSELLTAWRSGRDWSVFSYRYETSDSESTTTHPFVVVSVHCSMCLPAIEIRPENVFNKIGHLVGIHDLEFESDEFNRRYYVHSSDPKTAYGLFHPEMIEYLMQTEPSHFQLNGPWIVLVRRGMFKIEQVQTAVTLMEGFLAQLPDYLCEDSMAKV